MEVYCTPTNTWHTWSHFGSHKYSNKEMLLFDVESTYMGNDRSEIWAENSSAPNHTLVTTPASARFKKATEPGWRETRCKEYWMVTLRQMSVVPVWCKESAVPWSWQHIQIWTSQLSSCKIPKLPKIPHDTGTYDFY